MVRENRGQMTEDGERISNIEQGMMKWGWRAEDGWRVRFEI